MDRAPIEDFHTSVGAHSVRVGEVMCFFVVGKKAIFACDDIAILSWGIEVASRPYRAIAPVTGLNSLEIIFFPYHNIDVDSAFTRLAIRKASLVAESQHKQLEDADADPCWE